MTFESWYRVKWETSVWPEEMVLKDILEEAFEAGYEEGYEDGYEQKGNDNWIPK